MCSIYTRKGRGIGEETMRDTCGCHKVLRAAQQLRKMRNKHVCNEEAAWWEVKIRNNVRLEKAEEQWSQAAEEGQRQAAED